MTRVNIVTKMGENILSFFSYPQSVSCRISNVGTLHLLQSEVVWLKFHWQLTRFGAIPNHSRTRLAMSSSRSFGASYKPDPFFGASYNVADGPLFCPFCPFQERRRYFNAENLTSHVHYAHMYLQRVWKVDGITNLITAHTAIVSVKFLFSFRSVWKLFNHIFFIVDCREWYSSTILVEESRRSNSTHSSVPSVTNLQLSHEDEFFGHEDSLRSGKLFPRHSCSSRSRT